MGFNPNNEKDLGRLRQAAVYAEKQWLPFLQRRAEAIREVAGSNYGARGSGKPEQQLYPMLGLYVKVLTRLITSDNPMCHFNNWNPEASAHCKDLEIMVNDEFKRIELGNSIAEVVSGAMFGMGICKIGRVMKGYTEEDQGYLHESGGLFMDPVLDEDFLFDFRSKRWEGITFEGDVTRVSLEWAKSNKRFNKKEREKLSPSNRSRELPLISGYQQIRSQLLSSRKGPVESQDYEDFVDLWNFWLPREKMMLVLNRDFTSVLAVDPWEGPPRGCYHKLGFNRLPGNLPPLAPVAELMDIHLGTNEVANKVGDGVSNMKTNILAEGPTGEADGKAVVEAPDRGVVKVGSVGSIKSVTFNGPDQALIALSGVMLDKFDFFAGNVSALAGLGAQSETFKQDRLIAESASTQVAEMGAEVLKFTVNVMTDLAWYVKSDPDWSRQLVKDVPYADMKIPFIGRTADIAGDMDDYKLDVEPYSLKKKTPAERMMMLRQMVIELIIPLMPMMQQQGISLNMEKLLKKIAEYTDLPELADILIYNSGEQERPAGGGEEASTKPPQTTRKYVRENRSTKTRGGQANAAMAGVPAAPSQGAGTAVTIG
jgi:hypothetical protein